MSTLFARDRWLALARRLHAGLEVIRTRVQPRIDGWLRD